ncbi:hypothetical protein JWG44_11870 [Leptospira sp. 201903071]|uniref:hypothetical protein n=1 Tax=Leptospira ainazelensis TaxID=2810034 RepID=UPI0019658039|nr:hypothetical protein [Leptospira ainazelensis]MBM9500948.1 hypothetical protein [Leptospira ainazelensis]
MKKLLDKCIAFGEVVIAASEIEVTIPTLYTIEDDAYFYIYCPKIGIFAYGNDIKSAEDNLVDAISVNFVALHREGRIQELFLNPLEEEYSNAIETLKTTRDSRLLVLIAERHLNAENTHVFPAVKKGPQIYEITKQIKLKLTSENVRIEQIA